MQVLVCPYQGKNDYLIKTKVLMDCFEIENSMILVQWGSKFLDFGPQRVPKVLDDNNEKRNVLKFVLGLEIGV